MRMTLIAACGLVLAIRVSPRIRVFRPSNLESAVSILPFIVTPRNPGARRFVCRVKMYHAGMEETRRSGLRGLA